MTKTDFHLFMETLYEFQLKIDQKEYHGSLITYILTDTLKQPFWKPE